MLYLRAWRLYLGIKTLKEFSSITGFNLKTLSRFERDATSPQLRQIAKIAEKLNLNVEDLLKPPPACVSDTHVASKGTISPRRENVSPSLITLPDIVSCFAQTDPDSVLLSPCTALTQEGVS